MPSQAMQDVINALRDRQKASASQAAPTLEERRAAFTPPCARPPSWPTTCASWVRYRPPGTWTTTPSTAAAGS